MSESNTYSSTINVSLTSCQLALAYRLPEVAPNNNSVRTHFKIYNQGSEPVNLSEITLRYWYTKEGTADQNMWVDYAVVGSGNVTTSYAAMASPVSDADHYVEMGFTAGAGTLAAGANSGEFQLRFSNADWANLDETNDYSYNESYTDYTAWENVTLYCNGNLAWGIEPAGGTTPTNTPPTISFISPTNGETLNTGSITFQVEATDNDGVINNVSFDINGNSLIANNIGGNMYELTLNAGNAGTYTITATATDDDGDTNSETITITVTNNVLTCDTPTNAQESINGNSVTLSWDDMEAIEYQIAGRRAGGNWILITPTIANSRSFTLAANSYQWTVRALCSFEWTDWAAVRSFSVTGKNADAQHGFEGENIETLQISAFPNPTKDILNISVENPLQNEMNVAIYNILGEKVWTKKSENAMQNNFKVSVADLPKGLYFVKINNGLETAVEPFTVF